MGRGIVFGRLFFGWGKMGEWGINRENRQEPPLYRGNTELNWRTVVHEVPVPGRKKLTRQEGGGGSSNHVVEETIVTKETHGEKEAKLKNVPPLITHCWGSPRLEGKR